MSLLTLVQNVMLRAGFPSPPVAFASDDKSVRQIIALANTEGKTLSRAYDWMALQKIGSFILVAGQAQYTLPEDFLRPINRTFWDVSNRWQMMGSVSPQAWEFIKSGITSVIPYKRWRIFGAGASTFTVDPVPGVGDAGKEIRYEYISSWWCQSETGTGQTSWLADKDTGILDEEIMTLGVKWRFLANKGLAYADDREDYENERKNRAAQEKGASVLSTNGGGLYTGIPYPVSPDGNFG